ncbi:MAG: AraC family transcriptional regulator [Pseudomonadota bacterium]|nr:AraC family transcriptional regulator [Pseudomonadota bacterium]
MSALKNAVARYIEREGGRDGLYTTAIDGLALMRSISETLPHPLVYRPALCLVAQGAKRLALGDASFDYGVEQALIVSVELPGFGYVTEASRVTPFLGLVIEFDIGILREVLEQLDTPLKHDGQMGSGVFIDGLTSPVADCATRLVQLLDTPSAIPILYPSIMRELSFWLLTGANGSRIARMALPSGHAQRIADAISLMRADLARPVRVDELAAAARMSPSSFHQHFKTLTSMSPLQYQKQLRLLEARRLMVAETANVANAAYRVGYESASQFSREYARMFGAPPKRDISVLRMLAV